MGQTLIVKEALERAYHLVSVTKRVGRVVEIRQCCSEAHHKNQLQVN